MNTLLRKNPGSSALALLLLTLGFGALAAPVVLGKAAFVNPLPFRNASRLVLLQGIFTHEGKTEDWGISHIDFLDWRRQNKAFAQMAAFSPGEMAFNLVVPGQPAERLSGELVSYNYFSILGAAPALGRFFTPVEDGEPFTHPVAVLGHDLWQRRFGGDPKLVGQSVNLNGRPYTVVGVAPEGFRGITDKADAWIPSSMPPGPVYVNSRRMRWLEGVAPLEPGVTLEQAQADLDRVTSALGKQYPESNQGMGVRVQPLVAYWLAPTVSSGLRLLIAAGAVVLLLAFFSLAGLLRNRMRDAAVAAGVLLAALGAGLGLLLATWAVRALVPVSGISFPSFLRLAPDAVVIAGAFAVALLGGALAGLVARWRLAQSLAVVLQLGVALAVLAVAALISKGYVQAVGQDLGFRRDNLLILRADLQGPAYKEDLKVIETVRRYLDRLSKVDGIESLAICGPTVPTDPWTGGYVTIEDHDSDLPGGIYPIMMHSVSPGYFPLLDIAVLQGRGFTQADSGVPGTPYNVIVSKAMAEQQWPGQNPLGKRLKISLRQSPHPWLTVVGVVEDVRHQGLLVPERPAPDLYLPILISPLRLPTTIDFLVVPRPGVSTASLVQDLERGIQDVTPDSPAYDVATMQERLAKQTQKARLQVRLAELFAALLLLLAAVGVHSAVAGGTVPGVRGALGLAVAGIALGIAGAFVLGRRLSELLYGSSPGDPLILGGAAALILVLALGVSAFAARRRTPRQEMSRPDRPSLRDRAAL